MPLLGNEIRAALVALPATPESVSVTWTGTGGSLGIVVNLGYLQSWPDHADTVRVELDSGSGWQDIGPVTLESSQSFEVPHSTQYPVRFVAVNPNGETAGESTSFPQL